MIAASDLDDAIRLREDMRKIRQMREAMAGGAIPIISFGAVGFNSGLLSITVPIIEASDLFRRIFDAMDAAARKRMRELEVEPE